MDRIKRGYALVQMKRLDSEGRKFSGWATTASVDRMNDVVNPMGAKFTNPLALLRGHNSDQPIGTVTFKKPTKDGIEFDATIPVITEPGPLKDRTDMAWQEISNGVVRAVSIGFRPLKWSFKDDGGTLFDEVEIVELSTVAIPANEAAKITSVGKGMDAETLAVIKSFDVGSGRKGTRTRVRLDKSAGRVVRLSKAEILMAKYQKQAARRREVYEAAGIKVTRPVVLTAEDLAQARRTLRGRK